jgi:hypothetical protein
MSHHYSGPHLGFPNSDARLDLTDPYAFPKPGDLGKSILIMDVHPSFGFDPPAPTTSIPFAPNAIYEFKIGTNADNVADLAYRVVFSPFTSGGQTAMLRLITGPQAAAAEDGGELLIENAAVSLDLEGAGHGRERSPLLRWMEKRPLFLRSCRRLEWLPIRQRLLYRQRRVQHRSGGPELCTGARTGRSLGQDGDQHERPLDSGGSRGPSRPIHLPYGRGEGGLPRCRTGRRR